MEKAKKDTKKPVGRPTKYHEGLPKQLLDYFDRPLDREVIEQVATNSGVKEVVVKKPSRLPTVEGFCSHIKISKRTFHDWVAKYPSFSHALGIAKQMQMNQLITHTLENNFNAGFAKFLAMNISDMREKQEQKQEVKTEIKLSYKDE
jgi:hypothetical protein